MCRDARRWPLRSSSDEDRGNGGTQRMNCYLCLVETGCASRAAVAVCQRCGAGMCGAHLRELPAIPVVSLAGTPKSVLLCCRCAPSLVAPAARPMSERQETRAWRAQQVRREMVGKVQAERRPAEASRGCHGGGTLSQPAAPWVACSCEEDAHGGPASLLGASPCRPCGGCSHSLRALREVMGDCDGVVTAKLPTVTST